MATSIVRNQGDGDRRWFAGGGAHTWKAYAAETGNSLLVFEDELEQGKVTPMHFHADVDEALYVLEGEILLDDDGTEHKVGAGGFVFAPRGRAHAFMVVSDTARLLCIQTPGSAQDFYLHTSAPGRQLDGRGGRLRPHRPSSPRHRSHHHCRATAIRASCAHGPRSWRRRRRPPPWHLATPSKPRSPSSVSLRPVRLPQPIGSDVR